MIRHITIFKWREDAEPEQVAALKRALAYIPEKIPEIAGLTFGDDLGLDSGKFGRKIGVETQGGDFALVMDFNTLADFHTYNDHPERERLVNEYFRPIVVGRTSLQFEY